MSTAAPARAAVDPIREQNRTEFQRLKDEALKWSRRLHARIAARCFGGLLKDAPDSRQAPAAEMHSIVQMRHIADDVADLASRYFTAGAGEFEPGENDPLHDALVDAVQVTTPRETCEHRIDGQVYREQLVGSPDVLTEEVSIDLQRYEIDHLNREFRLSISRDEFDGDVICTLAGMRDENTAIYRVELQD